MNYAFQGKIEQAQEMSRQAIEISEKSRDIFAQTTPEVSRGLHYYLQGFFVKAEDSLLKGLAVCEKTGVIAWLTWALSWLGDLYADLGKYEKALNHYRRAIDIAAEIGFWRSSAYTWEISTERTKVLSGSKSLEKNYLYEKYKKINLEIFKGLNARHIAEILFFSQDPDFSEVEHWIMKAVSLNEKNGAVWQLGRDFAFYARLNLKTDARKKARENMSKAIEIFRNCSANGWVEKYEKDLSEI
jgi:tetratricopeptide (TPR) repeat protein